ncbi:MAG: adenosylmethionine--8-amino-7-oxononanoate transaminase [Planctomycetia bacterium]|nr:adenosylmethionine--8-amino-7-oxononanoate transaminase [Planctomycetia bacterium]
MNHASLRELDNAHVWHPFCQMQDFVTDDAPIIASAEGFELIDAEGRRYLDGVSSLWCNVHGHRVPKIDEAIRQQLDHVSHTTLLGLSNVPSIELAQRLIETTSHLSPNSNDTPLTKVFYSDDGATAVEVALKLAYQFHRQKPQPEARDLFVGLSGAYHGDTVGTASVGNIDAFHRSYERLLFPTLRVPCPATFRVPLGFDASSWQAHCFTELERTLAENADRIAAFIIEPLVQAAAGIIVHPEGYLRRVRELTNRHGILLIADEVAVGFGRTGTMFACEQESIVPDFLCLSKGITGGYLPLAATLTTDEVYSAFLGPPGSGRTFFHGHTYTGNPLGCAAALASLDLFEQNQVLANVAECTSLLVRRLEEIQDWPHVGNIRQKGILVGIELVADKATHQPFATSDRIGHRVTLEARKRGLFTRSLGDVITIVPAPAMPPGLVNRLCNELFASLESVTQ